MLQSASFFDLQDFPHAELFHNGNYVWDALISLKAFVENNAQTLPGKSKIHSGVPLSQALVLHEDELLESTSLDIQYGDATKEKLKVFAGKEELVGASVIMAGAVLLGQTIQIGRGVLIETGAMIKEPAIIGDCNEVRQASYLRGYCLSGKRCVLGHTTEIKHSIFLNDAKAGHFAYLGDSILGGNANLGAGTKMANLRFLPGNVQIKTKEATLDSGLRKFGAILGDGAQTGCNSVTNPGTLLGKDSILMPNTTAPSGYHPPKSVIR